MKYINGLVQVIIISFITVVSAYGKNSKSIQSKNVQRTPAQVTSRTKPQKNLSVLKQQYGMCRQERINLLQSCDNNNFLNTILILYQRNNQLEQAHKISSIKQNLGTIICNLTQANGEKKTKLCTLMRELDAEHEAFRSKYHQPMASIEREIAELTQNFLNSMPADTKSKLQSLLKEHHELSDKLRRLDPNWMKEQQRQQTIFELLFI